MSQITLLSVCVNSSRIIQSTKPTAPFQLDCRLLKVFSSYLLHPIRHSSGGGQDSRTHPKPVSDLSSPASVLSSSATWSTSSSGVGQDVNIQLSQLCAEPSRANEAGPSSQINTKLLLKELQSIQKNSNPSSQPMVHERVKFLWERWNEFLDTPKGKKLDRKQIHQVDHEFVFLYPSKLSQILEDYLELQHPSPISSQKTTTTRFNSRILKSIGFAVLKYEDWTVLKRLLTRRIDLNREDILTIVRSASKKILFSPTLKNQAARIENIIELGEVITDTYDEETECGKCMSQLIEILCDALLRMSCHQSATSLVLQILRQHPNFSDFFSPTFLHRLMRTCAAHQHLPLAHELLGELPTEAQTLDQFKACMSAWDRRTSRPLLHSTCSLWDALASHPHLTPDHDSYNLYLLAKSKLGHVEDVMRIINNMERRGIFLDDEGKQKTYGILLHSIGRRRGLQAACQILPELVSKGYKPDEYTSNILLSTRMPIKKFETNSENFQKRTVTNQEEKERKLIETMEMIKKANMKSDEVTRNIVVRSFLSRAPHHSREDILNLKSVALDESKLENVLDRNQFRRFRRPLYSMLCDAFRRADCPDELAKLEREWKSESFKARSKTNSIPFRTHPTFS